MARSQHSRAAVRVAIALSVLAFGGCKLKQRPGAQHASGDEIKAELETAGQDQKTASEHFYVQGRDLYDRCGERVVLRGINHMVIWTDRGGATFPEIAKTGANTIRIVWTVKDHRNEAELDQVLAKALAARLIPIIELHDATGDLSRVPALVDFWTRPAIVEVLRRHQASLLLNIANEAGGSGVQLDEFVAVYKQAIERLRRAGLHMPLVIDAPQWGQDIDLLQAAAPKLLAADPQRNLLFSAHLWWAQDLTKADPGSTKRIQAELEESVALGLPLIVGEFAHAGVGCSRSIDYKTILAETQKHGIGWLAWSWGPGNQDCHEMDMTENGTFDTLHGWGLEVAVTDPNSIQRTSKIPESLIRGKCARQLTTPPSPEHHK